jgi:hypothetical protein
MEDSFYIERHSCSSRVPKPIAAAWLRISTRPFEIYGCRGQAREQVRSESLAVHRAHAQGTHVSVVLVQASASRFCTSECEMLCLCCWCRRVQAGCDRISVTGITRARRAKAGAVGDRPRWAMSQTNAASG